MKKLFFSLMAAAFALTANAADEITSGGQYYIQNVESGLYLCGANNWGTRLTVATQGDLFTPNEADGKYALVDTELSVSANALGTILYTDSNGFNWTIEAVDGEKGVYTIKNSNGYIAQAAEAGNHIGYVANQVAEVTAAAKWYFLTADEAVAKLNAATKVSPVDASFLIGDANFSRNHSNTAWTMVAGNKNLGGGANENFCAESWRSTFTLTQTLSVPNGVYELTAQAALTDYDGGYNPEDNYPVVYANDESAVFNSMEESDRGTSMGQLSNSFSAGKYIVGPIKVNVTDGTLKIGVKGTRTNTWCIWDNFQIKYYGVDLSLLQKAFETALSEAEPLVQKDGAEMIAMNADAQSALKDVYETYKDATPATADDYSEAISALTDATKAAQDSKNIYEKIYSLLEKATELDESANDNDDLTYLQMYYESGEFATFAEAEAYYLAAVKAQSVGADMTDLIPNNSFDTDDHSAWNKNGKANPTIDGTWHNCEYYQKDFNLSMTITGMKKGTYEIGMNAFQRPGNANAAMIEAYENGTVTSIAQLYTTAEETDVPNIMKEKRTELLWGEDTGGWPNDSKVTYNEVVYYVPNSMQGAKNWFDAGYYKTTARAIVTEDGGSLTFGFKGTNMGGGWILFDNFTLKYISEDVLVAASESEKLIASIPTAKMNATLAANIQTAKTNLEADMTSGKLYNELKDAINAAESSVKYYAAVAPWAEVYEGLNATGKAKVTSPAPEIIADFNNGALNEEQFADVDAMINNYLIPNLIPGIKSQNIPGYDMSMVITNRGFEKGNLDGWTSTDGGNAANNGNFKAATGKWFTEKWTWNPNLSDGTLLQTITDLPAGVYTISATMQNVEQSNDDAVGTGLFIVGNVFKTEVTENGAVVSVDAVVGTDGVLTLGAEIKNCSGNWMSVDDFTLVYKNADKDAYASMAVSAEAKYGTFCAPFEVALPEGVKAYTATINGNGYTIDLAEVSTIAANTPVIVYAENGLNATVLSGKAVKSNNDITFGCLTGVYANTVAAHGSYVLQNQNNVVGFYPVLNDDVTIPANRCYLTPVGEDDERAKAYYFDIDSATAIEAVSALTAGKAQIYDMNGRKLNKLQKGINIVNGVKVLVK